MPNPKNGAKSAEKIPALIVFGRICGSNVNQAAVFLKKDAEAAKKAALDAGLSSLEVQTEEHRRAVAALPEGVINAQAGSRFRRPRQKSLLNSSACSKPQRAKGSFPTAAPNPRPHRRRFPPISGGNSSLGRGL